MLGLGEQQARQVEVGAVARGGERRLAEVVAAVDVGVRVEQQLGRADVAWLGSGLGLGLGFGFGLG